MPPLGPFFCSPPPQDATPESESSSGKKKKKKKKRNSLGGAASPSPPAANNASSEESMPPPGNFRTPPKKGSKKSGGSLGELKSPESVESARKTVTFGTNTEKGTVMLPLCCVALVGGASDAARCVVPVGFSCISCCADEDGMLWHVPVALKS